MPQNPLAEETNPLQATVRSKVAKKFGKRKRGAKHG
jgi:hypothetical protein